MVGPEWLWHPLGQCAGTHAEVIRCKSYNFWSGVSGSFITSLPGWCVALALFLRHHNCHEHGCWRAAKNGRTHCKKHNHLEGAK